MLELFFGGCEGGVGGLGFVGIFIGFGCCDWLFCWIGCDICGFIMFFRIIGFVVFFIIFDNLFSNILLLEDEEFWKKEKISLFFLCNILKFIKWMFYCYVFIVYYIVNVNVLLLCFYYLLYCKCEIF